MKRKFSRAAICCILICLSLVFAMVPVFAAENPTYVLSFRPGANGSFAEGADTYLQAFGTVQKTAAGNLFVEVPAGTPFPSGIVSYLQAADGYYYKDGLSSQETSVNADCDYVAQYGVLSGTGIRYTVNYLDSLTGAELAESYQGYANAGDVISFTAKAIQGYAADSAAKTLTVSDGAVLSFLYGSDGSNDTTAYVYGENTVITQTVNNQGGAGANPAENPAVNPEENPEENPAENPAEVVPEEEVPQAEAPQETTAAQSEVIEESEAPLASGADATVPNVGIVVGVTAAAVILLAAAAFLLRKKKSVK